MSAGRASAVSVFFLGEDGSVSEVAGDGLELDGSVDLDGHICEVLCRLGIEGLAQRHLDDARATGVFAGAFGDGAYQFALTYMAGSGFHLVVSRCAMMPRPRLIEDLEEIARTGWFEWDVTTGSLTWSSELYKIYGREPGSPLSAEIFMEHVIPEDRERIQAAVARALSTGETLQHLERIRSTDGKLHVLQTRFRAQLDAEGRPIRLVGACRDMTDVVEANDALRDQQLRVELLLEHAHVVLWELASIELGFSFVAGYVVGLLGFPSGDWYTEGFLRQRVVPEQRELLDSLFERAHVEKRHVQHELRLLDASGDVVWVDARVEPILQDGEVVGLRGALLDIDEKKKLEQQYLQAQKMEAIGALAGGVAHDFNNLLTVIGGCSEILKEEFEEDQFATELVTDIASAADRASQLTKKLLLFSRRTIREPSLIELNRSVRGVEALLGRLIGEDIEFICELADELPKILIDPNSLEQLMINLAVNARDAMPEGGTLELRTALVEDHVIDMSRCDCVMLTVRDTGVGIPESIRPEVFDPFFTTKDAQRGSGLGLSIVLSVVQEAGGAIELESSPERGTLFKVYFPVATSAPMSSESFQVSVAVQGCETILLCEDEDAVRRYVVRALEAMGYDVIEASTASQAIELARERGDEIEMLLTDVVMPQMGGRALGEEVRKLCPDISILYMSGYTDDAMLRHGVRRKTDALIAKPFSAQRLGEAVRELFDNM